MARKVPVRLRFEKIDAPDAKVHVTVNGEPCEMWAAEKFHNHPTGVVQVGYAEFVANPCGIDKNDKVGTKGCLPEMERGLKR